MTCGKIQSHARQDIVRRMARYGQEPYGKIQSDDVWLNTVKLRMARYNQKTCGKIQSGTVWQDTFKRRVAIYSLDDV